jgi:Flp pilus assembly protein TadG
MKIFRNEDGQMLVFTALSMTILFGMLGIAFEVGMMFREKRYQQTAADAAAQAAALDYYYNNARLGATAITHATTEANTTATNNGFTNGQNGTTITVACPPANGPEAGAATCNGFFEVIINKNNKLPFMAAFGGSTGNAFPVAARAVAGTPSPNDNCIWLMDPTVSAELKMNGSASTLNAPGCGVYLNSSSANAVSFTGNPSVDVLALNLISSQDLTKGTKNFTGQFNNNVVPESPPFPTNFQGAGTGDCNVTYSGPTTITSSYTPAGAGSPSGTTPLVVCFTQAMTISGGTQASPIVMAGLAYTGGGQSSTSAGVVYEFQQGLTIGTGAWVNFGSSTYTAPGAGQTIGTFSNTSGATIDMEGGAFNVLSGQANLSVYAPTAADYNGIAIMQPSSNKSASSDNTCNGQTNGCLSVQFGSASTFFDGMIFVPGGQVSLHDQGAGATASGLIADTFNMASSTMTIDNYSNANPFTTPLRRVQLTE